MLLVLIYSYFTIYVSTFGTSGTSHVYIVFMDRIVSVRCGCDGKQCHNVNIIKGKNDVLHEREKESSITKYDDILVYIKVL